MADATLYTKARSELGAAVAALRAATKPVARLDAATVVLRILGNLAANAPTEELRTRWLAQYRALQPEAARLRAEVTDAAPGAVLRALDKFSDAVLAFGGEVLEGAGGLAQGIGGIAKAGPWLLLALLAVAAIVVVQIGPQLVRSWRGRK